MGRDGPGGRVRLIEVVVLVFVLGVMLILLLPAINVRTHGPSRGNQCFNNLKQIGLGLQNYASANNNRFPASADLISSGGTPTVGGYSFLVKILADMEYGPLYDSLMKGPAKSMRPDDPANTNGHTALQRSIKEFICPSNPNPLFVNLGARPPDGAFTNYKAMGATCQKSLQMVLAPGGTPPYGTKPQMHPDGGLFPNTGGIRLGDYGDGTAHTILVGETIDDISSRWTVGREVTMVGLPNATVVGAVLDPRSGVFYAPKGFDGTYGPKSPVSRTFKTFLTYNFKTGNPGPYEDPGFSQQPATYGPSSGHATVVNHLMGDGSVQSIAKDIDPAAYMFLITRAGGEQPLPE